MPPKGIVKAVGKDSKKEKIFKILSQILTDAGFVVRREELKRGFGWKVVSGTCRLNDDKIVFIDRRMTQEDQLSFLTSKIVLSGISVDQARLTELESEGWKLTQSASVGEGTHP